MNFKRFISGVSAFAIAASAFAGLAVTADAATPVNYVNDDFNSMTQEDGSSSLSTDSMTWTVSGGSVQIRSIGSNNWSSSPSYLLPMPMARSNQGDFKSKDGNFLYIAGYVNNNASHTATGVVSDPLKKVTDGSISFDFAFPFVQLSKDRIRNNKTQTLNISDGTNTIAKIAVTDYAYYGTPSSAYGTSPATVVIGGTKEEDTVSYTSTNSATTCGWYSFNMNLDSATNTASIKVTTPANTVLEKSFKYDANNGINTLSWIGDFAENNNIANIAIDNIKFVQNAEEAGYVIRTTPYAEISVDGGAAVNVGSTGIYMFDLGDEGSKSVKISKSGYETLTETIDAKNNQEGSYKLTPSDGRSYYEDFSTVNDNFGLVGSNGGVSDGVIWAGGGNVKDTFVLPETLSIDGKMITLEAKIDTTGRNARLNLVGDGAEIKMYIRMGEIRVNDQVTNAYVDTDYHTIQLYTNNGSVTAYLDGKQIYSYSNAVETINSIYMGGDGGTNTVRVRKITVENKPDDVNVTINDTVGTYLDTATVTLPTPADREGYTFAGTYNDGAYQAGQTFTASEIAGQTFTADFVKNPTATAEWKQDYETATGDESVDKASLWQLDVDANDVEITSVDVTVNGNASAGAVTGAPVIAKGSNAVFAIVINHLKDEINSIDAFLNNITVNAYTAE